MLENVLEVVGGSFLIAVDVGVELFARLIGIGGIIGVGFLLAIGGVILGERAVPWARWVKRRVC